MLVLLLATFSNIAFGAVLDLGTLDPAWRGNPPGHENINAVGTYRNGQCISNGGSLYLLQIDFDRTNLQHALSCSKKRCLSKEAIGCRDWGYLLAEQKQYRLSIVALERACVLGDAIACEMVGSALLGNYTEAFTQRTFSNEYESQAKIKDLARAEKWLNKGCELKRIQSCALLGKLLLRRKERVKSVPFLKRACAGRDYGNGVVHRAGCVTLAEMAKKKKNSAYHKLAELACEQQPGSLTCRDYALVLLKEGKVKKAQSLLQFGCRLGVENTCQHLPINKEGTSGPS